MNNILYDYDMLSWYVSLSIPGKGLLLRHRAISVHSRQFEADEGRWYCTTMHCCHGGTQWSQIVWKSVMWQCCKKLKRRKPVSHSFQSALSTSPVRLQRPWRLLVRKGGAMQLWAVCSMRNGPTCAALLCSILLIIPNPGQMWDAMSLAFCNSKGQRESLINHCLLKSMEDCSRSFDDMSRHHFLAIHVLEPNLYKFALWKHFDFPGWWWPQHRRDFSRFGELSEAGLLQVQIISLYPLLCNLCIFCHENFFGLLAFHLGARNWVLMDDAGWNSTNSAWQKAKDAGILTQAKWIMDLYGFLILHFPIKHNTCDIFWCFCIFCLERYMKVHGLCCFIASGITVVLEETPEGGMLCGHES